MASTTICNCKATTAATARVFPGLLPVLLRSTPAHSSSGSLARFDAAAFQRHTQPKARPPVPLFHSNSTGNIAHQQQTLQQHHSSDFDLGAMGGEINVAYDGTFGDLSAAGGANYFDMADLDFDTALDSFTAIHGNGNGATVSPKDLFNDSVPPSTTFTNLTTPDTGFLETPGESFDTSPLFQDSFDMTKSGADNWYPLFDDAGNAASMSTPAPVMQRTTSNNSNAQVIVHPGGESHRKRSSVTASPMTFNSRPSSVAGIQSRKNRDKTLPPIIVDENDSAALKRARNTAAARKSRDKKVREREGLEGEIAELKRQVEHWRKLAISHGADAADGPEEL
ncbi:hypothetical protein MBLNU230_g1231t1 [Neophaeotheca triangularis]